MFVANASMRISIRSIRVTEKRCEWWGRFSVLVDAINIRAVIQIVRRTRGVVRRSSEKSGVAS